MTNPNPHCCRVLVTPTQLRFKPRPETNSTKHHHGNTLQTVWWSQPSEQNHYDYACTVWYSNIKLSLFMQPKV